ncbi:MAG: type II secretion system protein [Planctomycetota bacterium]|jgi:prepilin-type N-terminal cleavage/methylation domain-containing protein/prepilin-type processing-associated H-X9-DG protein
MLWTSRQVRDVAAGRGPAAFTLVELLVVVAIIALLVTVLMPSLTRAMGLTRKTVCMSNLRGQGLALRMYAMDNEDIVAPYYVVINDSSVNGLPDWVWHWCDFLSPYFGDGSKAPQWKQGSWYTVGRQPSSGNYSEHANLGVVYSELMYCPGQKRIDKFHFLYNRTWTGNWTPGGTKPRWNSDPLKVSDCGSPDRFGQILEPDFYFWQSIRMSGSFAYVPALAASPVHLDTMMNFAMLDGHVETWTDEEILDRSYQVLGKWDFPFAWPQ